MNPFYSVGTTCESRSSSERFKTPVSHFILRFGRMIGRSVSTTGCPESFEMRCVIPSIHTLGLDFQPNKSSEDCLFLLLLHLFVTGERIVGTFLEGETGRTTLRPPPPVIHHLRLFSVGILRVFAALFARRTAMKVLLAANSARTGEAGGCGCGNIVSTMWVRQPAMMQSTFGVKESTDSSNAVRVWPGAALLPY